MARLYTIEKHPVERGHKWECVYRVKMNETSIPNYGELDRWTRQNFRDPYVLMAFMSQMIAGGAFGPGAQNHCPDRQIRVDYYELRCSATDARRFIRTWRVPKAEYEQNMQFYIDRQNMAQGWVKVNGKPVPIHTLVPKKSKRQPVRAAQPKRSIARGVNS